MISKGSRMVKGAVRRFIADPREASLLMRLAFWVAVMSVAARCFSLPRALRMMSARPTRNRSPLDEEHQTKLARSLDLVLSADILMFRPICWKRAAVLHRFLASGGVVTEVCFGVRTDATGTVEGHAWLESNGLPILEKMTPDYVRTYTFPASRDLNNAPVLLSSK